MEYLKLNNIGEVVEYPYPLYKLATDYPQVSFPRVTDVDLLAEYNVYQVLPIVVPNIDPNFQKLVKGGPELVNGAWYENWIVTELNEAELEAKLTEWRSQAVCSPLQAQIALHQFNKLAEVELYMSAETTPLIEKLAYQKATEFRRLSPLIIQMKDLFGWTDEELDNLFKVAMTIEV